MAQLKQDMAEFLDSSASHLLHRSVQIAAELFAEEIGPGGLTARQYTVLFSVAQNPGLSQTDLVAITGIDRSTLADIVRRMLRKGLVLRKRTRADQRAYAVRLSEEGERLLADYNPKAIAADERILQLIPDDLRASFMAAIHHLVVNGDTNQPESIGRSNGSGSGASKAGDEREDED